MRHHDALLLIGHGSARYPDAGAPLLAHAAALRALHPEIPIAVGFLNGAPNVGDALASLTAPKVRVVPFFMEDGYFTRIAVPRALAGVSRDLRFCPPVGVHPAMADLIAARVRRTVAADPMDVALILVGHGSARNPGQSHAMARHIEALRPGFAAVRAAFLEEAPSLSEVLADLPVGPLAILGLFANQGYHMRDDLPTQLARAEPRVPAPLDLGSIADDPGMPNLILDQARAA